MDIASTIILLVVVFLGSYFQALTGFALGIVLMGYVALFSTMPLAIAASMLTILGLVNTLSSLGKGGWGRVDWAMILRLGLGVVPGTIAGLFLLENLKAGYAAILQLILGVTIIFAAVSLIIKPKPYPRKSLSRSFFFTGFLGGLLGGLFGVPGPPLIYHLYRQPVSVETIRTTLLVIFATICLFRLSLEFIQGTFNTAALHLSLLGIPVTAFAGWLYVRLPPRVSDTTVRRGSFILFGVLGLVITLVALQSENL